MDAKRLFSTTLISVLFGIIFLLSACNSPKNTPSRKVIKISDISIVPRDAYVKYPQGIIKNNETITLAKECFTPAGKKYAEIGATNPNSTIVHSKQHKITLLLDSVQPDANKADLLRINLSNSQDFTNSHSIKLITHQVGTTIPPTVIDTTIDSIPARLNVHGSYHDFRNLKHGAHDRRDVYIGLYSCLQGKCEIDGKQYLIEFADRNSNLQYNDKPKLNKDGYPLNGAPDTLAVYEIDTSGHISNMPIIETYCGSPVKIGEDCFNIDYLPENHTITIQPDSTKMAKVKLNTPNARIMLINTNNSNTDIMSHCISARESMIPAGTYNLFKYEIIENKWLLQSNTSLSGKKFKIQHAQQNNLSFALPLKPVLNINKNSSNNYELLLKLLDADQRSIMIIDTDSGISFPSFRIKDSEGKTIHTGQSEYG